METDLILQYDGMFKELSGTILPMRYPGKGITANTSTIDNIFLSRARLALIFLLALFLCGGRREEVEGGLRGQLQW